MCVQETGCGTGTCEAALPGGVFTHRGVYMKLYELDAGGIFWGRDDHVTTLNYGDIP